MTDPTPLSLREARQREAEARSAWVRKNMVTTEFSARDVWSAVVAARRATDEALVRAVVFWLEAVPESEWKDINDWSAVLDAVEREETER